MYCESIVTHVKHEVGDKTRQDSFFVINCEAREHFTLQILGECFVDHHSMWNYISWVDGGIKQLVLMVSLDYKYAMFRHVNDAGEIELERGEQILPLLPNLRHDSDWADKAQGVYGSPVENLIPLIEREIAPSPLLCSIYDYKPNIKNIELAHRVNLEDRVFEFGLNTVDNGILNGIDDISLASDDALFWLHLLKDNKNPKLAKLNHGHVFYEIHLRLNDGRQVHPMFYAMSTMSLGEIQLRSRRAKRILNRVSKVIKQESGIHDVQAILQELTNDEALELYVVGFWGSGEQGELEWYIANELNGRALENRPL